MNMTKMKTITPNSDEDLVNQYYATTAEYLEWSQRGFRNTPFNERMHVDETYKNCLRFLEKNIKERQLYN